MSNKEIKLRVCKRCNERILEYKAKKYCKICKEKNYKEAGYRSSVKRMIRNREFIKNYKKDKKCQMCGYKKYPEILDFYHQNAESKDIGINILMKTLKPLDVIKKEIEKCILVCPNCHRELHLIERLK